jgi:hypothetical protein
MPGIIFPQAASLDFTADLANFLATATDGQVIIIIAALDIIFLKKKNELVFKEYAHVYKQEIISSCFSTLQFYHSISAEYLSSLKNSPSFLLIFSKI